MERMEQKQQNDRENERLNWVWVKYQPKVVGLNKNCSIEPNRFTHFLKQNSFGFVGFTLRKQNPAVI
jgi:hypothetical protein